MVVLPEYSSAGAMTLPLGAENARTAVRGRAHPAAYTARRQHQAGTRARARTHGTRREQLRAQRVRKGGGVQGGLAPSAITSNAGTQQQQQPKYRTCDAAHPGPGVGGSPVPQEGGLSTVRRPTFLLVFLCRGKVRGGRCGWRRAGKSRQTEGEASGEQSQAGHGGRAECGERGAEVGAAR